MLTPPPSSVSPLKIRGELQEPGGILQGCFKQLNCFKFRNPSNRTDKRGHHRDKRRNSKSGIFREDDIWIDYRCRSSGSIGFPLVYFRSDFIGHHCVSAFDELLDGKEIGLNDI
jgi:hypothetical protein